MMAWVDAVRKYAEQTGKKFRIYKKGTAEYEEIKKIQRKGTGALTKAQTKKMVSEMAGRKRGRPKKAVASALAPAGEMKRKVEETPEGGLKVTLKKARKVRSDKGKKRGARKAKAPTSETTESEEFFSYA